MSRYNCCGGAGGAGGSAEDPLFLELRDVEQQVLCDDTVSDGSIINRFIRHYQYVEDGTSVETIYDTEIDGTTTYTPQGTVTLCSEIVEEQTTFMEIGNVEPGAGGQTLVTLPDTRQRAWDIVIAGNSPLRVSWVDTNGNQQQQIVSPNGSKHFNNNANEPAINGFLILENQGTDDIVYYLNTSSVAPDWGA